MEREVEKALDLARVEFIIDFGCGTGSFLKRVSKRLAGRGKVFGIEPSNGMLKIARKKVRNHGVNLIEAQVENLPFKDSSFDAGTMIQSFHHFSEHEMAIREIWRVMKPGATLILCDTTLDSIYEKVYHALIILREKRASRFPLPVLEGLFRKAGFEITGVKKFFFLIPVTLLIMKKS